MQYDTNPMLPKVQFSIPLITWAPLYPELPGLRVDGLYIKLHICASHADLGTGS